MDRNASHADTEFMVNKPAIQATAPADKAGRRPSVPVTRWELADLQGMSAVGFEAALAHAVEHAPWVARRAWAARPFDGVEDLVQAMRDVILSASTSEQTALLRGHPELAGSEAREGRMTADSTTEQGRLGLDRLDRPTLHSIEVLNHRYRGRFGYPLVIALRLHADLESVLKQANARLANEAADELPLALEQVCEVMRGRIERLVTEPAPTAVPRSAPQLAAGGTPG